MGDGIFVLPVAVREVFQIGDLSGEFHNHAESDFLRALQNRFLYVVIPLPVPVEAGRPDDRGVQSETSQIGTFPCDSAPSFILFQQQNGTVKELFFHDISSANE